MKVDLCRRIKTNFACDEELSAAEGSHPEEPWGRYFQSLRNIWEE